MKKTLLLLTILAAAATASAQMTIGNAYSKSSTDAERISAPASLNDAEPRRAVSRAGETTLTFALCGAQNSAVYFTDQSVGDEVWQAVEISKANVEKFAGKRITAINIANPTNRNYVNTLRNVTVFLTYDLNGTPFYTQDATLGSSGFEYSNISLTTPYTIEADKPVYFGYYFTHTTTTVSEGNYYYVIVDAIPTDNLQGAWCKYKTGGQYVWDNVAETWGSLCITADITGEDMPVDCAGVSAISCPSLVSANAAFTFTTTVRNLGANAISSIELEYSINNGEAQTKTFTPSNALNYFQDVNLVIDDAVCPTSGGNIPVTAKVTKVNGVANNQVEGVSGTAYMDCLVEGAGYSRNVVIEEATGTWCGWCPGGIVAMEYIREKYTDGSFICIGVHSGDQMQTSTYSQFINQWISGYPSYVISRKYSATFYNDAAANKEAMDNYYNELHGTLATCGVGIVATSDASTVNVTANVEFAIDTDAEYRLAFVLVEDNVGPYTQANYYARAYGTGYTMDGWESKDAEVSTIFNDVARGIYDCNGIAESLPADIKAGVNYTYEKSLSLSSLSNKDNFRVVALLINYSTGEIENAIQTTVVGGSGAAGVESAVAEASALTIGATTGAVTFSGDYAEATVYTIYGAVVAKAHGESSVALPAGIYVVKADDIVAKVIVR